MKKITFFLAAILILSSTAVFGAYDPFTDSHKFDDWFHDSAYKMQEYGIMQGYPENGEFKGEKPVLRSELAVILDRTIQMIDQGYLIENETTLELNKFNEIKDEAPLCTAHIANGFLVHLQDTQGHLINDASVRSRNYGEEVEFYVSEHEEGKYYGLQEAEEGYYDIIISRNGYNDHEETVKMERDECHVITQRKTITLVPNPA